MEIRINEAGGFTLIVSWNIRHILNTSRHIKIKYWMSCWRTFDKHFSNISHLVLCTHPNCSRGLIGKITTSPRCNVVERLSRRHFVCRAIFFLDPLKCTSSFPVPPCCRLTTRHHSYPYPQAIKPPHFGARQEWVKNYSLKRCCLMPKYLFQFPRWILLNQSASSKVSISC